MMHLHPGDKAPQFELFSSNKEKIRLEDFRGKTVIVLFFPQAFTGVCTKELKYFNEIPESIKGNIEILAISVDSVFTLNQFKEAQAYEFELLSDFNKQVSRSYGSLYENWIFDMKGVSKRAAFIVDKKGLLQYVEVLEDAGDEPNYEAIVESVVGLEK